MSGSQSLLNVFSQCSGVGGEVNRQKGRQTLVVTVTLAEKDLMF